MYPLEVFIYGICKFGYCWVCGRPSSPVCLSINAQNTLLMAFSCLLWNICVGGECSTAALNCPKTEETAVSYNHCNWLGCDNELVPFEDEWSLKTKAKLERPVLHSGLNRDLSSPGSGDSWQGIGPESSTLWSVSQIDSVYCAGLGVNTIISFPRLFENNNSISFITIIKNLPHNSHISDCNEGWQMWRWADQP